MSFAYGAYRRDANEPDIVELLEAHGFQTWPLDGAPFDLIVWKQGGRGFLLLEIKSGKRGRLTKQQTTFFDRTVGLPRLKVATPDEALAAAKAHAA